MLQTTHGSSAAGVQGGVLRHLFRLAAMGAVGLVGGIFAGGVVGGLGSRLVMRILMVINGSKAGIVTANGNIAGEITLNGTAGLIIFGAFAGGFGGLVYIAVRRWIPGRGWRKGLMFGVLLFMLFGFLVIGDGNEDFRLFGPSVAGVALFALLFPLYGLAISLIVERVNQYVPPVLYERPLAVIGYLGLAGASVIGLIGTIASFNAIF